MALGGSRIMTTIGVTDQDASTAFYSDVLGLHVISNDPGGVALGAGGGTALFLYVRPGHRPPENTVAAFLVSDFDEPAQALRDRGVMFEDYDLPGLKTENGVATDPDMGRSAWFKDPDGNILSLTEQPPG